MKNAVKSLLIATMFALPTAAFASNFAYPLNPAVNGPFDIFVDGVTGTSTNLSGTVEAITDVPNTQCPGTPCPVANVVFTANSSGFSITGIDPVTSATNVTFLAGTYNAGSYINAGGGEYGALFTVTQDNATALNDLEFLNGFGATLLGGGLNEAPASNILGETVSLNYDADGGVADLDIYSAPVVTPEPTTLTLLFSGLAAGYFRKKRATSAK